MDVNLELLPSSVTGNFLSEDLKFSVVVLKCHAYFRTEVRNRCMDGGASICDCSAATISGTLLTSLSIRPKHHPQHLQRAYEDWIHDG